MNIFYAVINLNVLLQLQSLKTFRLSGTLNPKPSSLVRNYKKKGVPFCPLLCFCAETTQKIIPRPAQFTLWAR